MINPGPGDEIRVLVNLRVKIEDEWLVVLSKNSLLKITFWEKNSRFSHKIVEFLVENGQ